MSLETHTDGHIQVESVSVEDYAQYIAQVQAAADGVVTTETVTLVQAPDDLHHVQAVLVSQPDCTTDLGQAIQAVAASNAGGTVYVTHHALEGDDAEAHYATLAGGHPGTVLVAQSAEDLEAISQFHVNGNMVTTLQPSTLFITQTDDQPILQSLLPPVALPLALPPPPPPSTQIRKPVGKGPFPCEICQKVFRKWNQLQRHVKTHDEDKPFRCHHCSMSFNIEDNLTLHLATHVQGDDEPTCPECGKKFSRIASLKAHIMLHEKEETLMCPECGDEFSLQSQLDKHIREHREEEEGTRTYPCRQCTQEFPRLATLREHMKQHYKIKSSLHHRSYKRNIDRTGFIHKCNNCGKSFQKPSQLERHNRIHTGERPFKCTVCDKAFNQKGALQIHMSKHTGERPYICDFCDAPFAQKGNLRAHITRVHPLTTEKDPIVNYRCEECTCVFRKLGSLNAHISRMHSDPDIQDVPSQVVRRNLQPNKAGVTDVIQQLLQLSDNQQNNADIASGHAAEPTDQAMDTDPSHQIGDAAEKAGQASDILQQALENSGLTNTTTRTSTIINGAIVSMAGDLHTIDGVTSTLQVHDGATGLVKRHVIRKVNGIRWHQCTYCCKEFKKPSDLVRHIRIHTHEKPYKCTQCFRAFAVKSTLTAHVKTHTGVKEFKCMVCDKHFSTQGSLKVHLRLHTGAKPFDCPTCDKKFRTSAHRKSHIQSHFRGEGGAANNRPRRSFRRTAKADLNVPDIPLQEPILITDTGLIQQPIRNNVFQQCLGEGGTVDRPYKCAFCQRCFKKSSHLKQHIRSHTGEKPYKCLQCLKAFVSNGVLKAHIRTHTGAKSYKCMICDCTFTTNGSLKRHMSTHSEVRPFMCPYCQKTFKTSVNCKKHMKTHRHELALQALQDEGQGTDGEDGTVQTAGIDHQTTELASLTGQSDLTTATTSLTQEMNAHVVLQDALTHSNLDQQLTLTQQVFGQQNINQQSFTQSLLGTQHTFSQLNNFNQNTFTVQGTQLQHGIDINTLNTSFSQPANVSVSNNISTSLASTSMQNILQTREPRFTNYHNLSPETVQREVEEGKRAYRCEFCHKAFKKSSHLKQHVRSHTGEKPYKCLTCNRQFVSTGVLKAHLKTHTGIKDYSCMICQAQFTTNGSLTRHMAIHNSIHQFKCPYCPETFRTAVHCKRHMRVHREVGDEEEEEEEEDVGGRERTRYTRSMSVIQITDEETAALSKSNQHISVSEKILIESASEKDRISEVRSLQPEMLDEDSKHPHSCPHCSKSFKKPSDLVRHLRIHTGEKPYGCDHCGRSFTVKSTLDSHMKTHGAGDKRYKCHVCNSMFSTKGSLKVHMRLHTGAKPFKCPHCEQRFRTSGHRKSHILSHFKEDLPRKRKISPRVSSMQPISLLEDADHDQVMTNVNVANAGLAGQVINIDQSNLQQQNILPLAVGEGTGSLTESALAAHVLQGLEGIQLHFAGNLGQGIQITGLDPGLLSQTVQIDGNLLQQLQQQGNINITINPNLISQNLQAADPNLVQNVQIQPVSILESINPNVLIQPMSAIVSSGLDTQTVIAAQQVADLSTVTLENGQEATFLVAADGTDAQQVTVEGREIGPESPLPIIENAGQSDEERGVEEGEQSSSGLLEEGEENLSRDEAADVSFGGLTDADLRTHVCHLCQKAFKRSSHLKEHLMTHVPGSTLRKVRQTPHECVSCQKSFQKPSQLERHMRIHTGERPFACEICQKAFNQKNALMIHLKKHSGDKPHKCAYCELAFTQKGNLKTHIKRAHHLDMVLSMNLPNVPQPGDTIIVGVAPDDDTQPGSVADPQDAPEEPSMSDVDNPVEETPAPQEETLDLEITELFQ